jgi:hypothetical protein
MEKVIVLLTPNQPLGQRWVMESHTVLCARSTRWLQNLHSREQTTALGLFRVRPQSLGESSTSSLQEANMSANSWTDDLAAVVRRALASTRAIAIAHFTKP